jgi:hypothetical protein
MDLSKLRIVAAALGRRRGIEGDASIGSSAIDPIGVKAALRRAGRCGGAASASVVCKVRLNQRRDLGETVETLWDCKDFRPPRRG